MGRFLVTVCIMLLCAGTTARGESVYLDNHEIQQYRGCLGQWILAGTREKLFSKIRLFHSSYGRVAGMNSTLAPGSFVFIPFSDAYLSSIRKSDHQRACVDSQVRRFIWPLESARKITSSFGMRRGHLHAGVDISAGVGELVIAAMDGRVVSASYSGGHGKSIYIEHRGNFFTRYSHNSVMLVKKNDIVKKGQVIGLVGSTGNSTGNHLHFEIRFREIPLNPLDFLPHLESIEEGSSSR